MTQNKPLAGVIDIERIHSVVHRRCKDNGVTVTFDPGANTASTNGKHITIPALKHPVTQDALDTLYGYVIHECGHHSRPEAFKILNNAQPPEHVCALFNIAEDDGMEREVASKWRGDKAALSNMNNIITQSVTESWKNPLAQADAAQQPEPLASMLLGQMSRQIWDDISGPNIERMIKIMPEKVTDLLTDLIDEGWVDRFRGTTSPHEAWDVAIDLAKRLYPGSDPAYEKCRAYGHGTERHDPKKDKWKDKKGTKEEGDPDAEGKVISWKDVVLSEHNEWQERAGVPGNMGIDWKGMINVNTHGAGLMPLNMVNVVDMSKSNCSTDSRRGGWEQYLPKNDEARAFANRVRRYLQAQTRTRVRRHRYHGRLDPASIVKLALPPIDGGEWNKKIFYEQDKGQNRDTAIFVLTDWSGSMNGHKMRDAADASQRLVYVMDRVLHIPVALATFSNGRSKCDVGYIKPFGHRGITQEEIAKRFAKFHWYTSANNDADAVNWAYHQLRKRNERRKLLIVLSDGCPAGSWTGRSGDNLKYICRHIEAEGKIELYGVGIRSDAVASYYTNHKILTDSDQINATLFNLIKEGDHSGYRR